MRNGEFRSRVLLAAAKQLRLDGSGQLWPREAVECFVRTADRMGRWSVGTAVLLNEWLGQRQGDVLRLPRNLLRPEGLALRQRKTGAGVVLPVAMVPHLAARVEMQLDRMGAKKRQVETTRLIVTEERVGEPYKADHFRHVFAEVRAEAAKEMPSFPTDYIVAGRDPDAEDAQLVRMEDLWFMHLRHTAVTRLHEAGAGEGQISAITGHSLAAIKSILDRYLIRTGELARLAFAKRMEAEEKGVQLTRSSLLLPNAAVGGQSA